MFAYMGGKSKQSKWIVSTFPTNYDLYVEVFGGAFWVYISNNFKNITSKIIYNDIDPMMYNLWSCIKIYNDLIPLLEKLPKYDKEFFYECRDKVRNYMNGNTLFDVPDFNIVIPFIYWQTHSFSGDINGGMSKVNNHIGMLNRLKRKDIQQKINRMVIENLSYEKVIEKYDSDNTLFYIDPPYYNREHFYGFHPFTVNDHEKLSKILLNVKSKFVLSYYRTKEIEDLYDENIFNYNENEYKRSSTSIKQNGKKDNTVELLIRNFK
jgi:DNA adenine methylase